MFRGTVWEPQVPLGTEFSFIPLEVVLSTLFMSPKWNIEQ